MVVSSPTWFRPCSKHKFDNPFYMAGDPEQCVDATVQFPNSLRFLMEPNHTIPPRPPTKCEWLHIGQGLIVTTKRSAAVVHPNAQLDAFPFHRSGIHQVHSCRTGSTCILWVFPNMTKSTLIKTDDLHSNMFIL